MQNTLSLFCCVILIGCVSISIFGKELNAQSTIRLQNQAEIKGKIWNGDEIRRSALLYINASENWEMLGEFRKASDCLRESAKLSFLISKEFDAIEKLITAINLDQEIDNIDGQVISHTLLFQAYQSVNNTKSSEFHFNKAFELMKNSNPYPKAFFYLAAGKNNLHFAEIKIASKQLNKAFDFILMHGDKKLEAEILLNLGILSAIKGNKDVGLKKINEAQTLWNSIDYKRGSALVSNAIGFLYVITDEKQKALNYFRQAENMIPQDADFEERAKSFGGIASIYVYYRYFELAEKYLLITNRWYKKTNNTFAQLLNLMELGNVQYLRGNIAESKTTFEKAYTISKDIDARFVAGHFSFYTGIIELAEGNTDTAIESFKQTLEVYKKLGINIPKVYNLIGKAYKQKGNYIDSRKYYELAAESSKQTKENSELAEALSGIAHLLSLEGNLLKALEKSKESIQITESFFNDAEKTNLKVSYFSDSFDRYDLHINLLMELHNKYPQKGYDLLAFKSNEKSRSRVMLENLHLSLNNTTIGLDPVLVDRENKLKERLTNKKEELSSYNGQNEIDKKVLDKLRIEVAQIKDDLHNTQALLRKSSPIYASIKNSLELNLSDLQNKLIDEETILLEFFFGKEKSFVWLIEDSKITSYQLPKSDILNNKITNLLKILDSEQNINKKDITNYYAQLSILEKTYWESAKDLSKVLFEQFADKLKNKRLIIVPDGNLRSFPMSALPSPINNKNEPLLLTNEIVYEPSASMLLLLKSKTVEINPPRKDFLVFSDPVFSVNDKRLKNFLIKSAVAEGKSNWEDLDYINNLDNLPNLPASKQESSSIFKFYDQRNSKIISGFDANRTELLSQDLHNYKVLHFATHGLFNEEVPELSGIVLSRFDKEANKQNGLLWLQDIYGLKLSSDLVVLSACQTGVGNEIKGEGLMSLTNGFLQVGAKSIISSHWKVDDYKTSELMNDFYQILSQENITPSKALQKAKIKMYNNPNNKFPFYWASFTFHGDFQNKPDLKKRFDYYSYLMLIILILGMFLILAFSKNKKVI